MAIDATGFKAEDDASVAKFRRFLNESASRKADLTLSPEYSCPWPALEGAIKDGARPKRGGLWLLGCQSISRDEVSQLESRIGCKILYENNAVQDSNKNFVDPLAISFVDSSDELVVVLQFKTQPMGVKPIPNERDNLVCGSRAYAITNNDDDSIILIPVICSDALDFVPQSFPGFATKPILVCHLQLNPKPRQHNISRYRAETLRAQASDKEIISLNWAVSTRANYYGKEVPITDAPHSALYTKSTELDVSDARLQHNHERGLYLFRWDDYRAMVYVASYDEHCLELQLTKPFQGFAPAETCLRTGPAVKDFLTWNGKTWVPGGTPDDGVNALLKSVNLQTRVPYSCNSCQLTLERFVALATGNVSSIQWIAPKELEPLALNAGEVLVRTAYARDPEGRASLDDRMSRLRALYDIFDVANGFGTGDLKPLGGASLDYKPDRPHDNVYHGQQPKGTALFLGMVGNEERAIAQLDRVVGAVSEGYRRFFSWFYVGAKLSSRVVSSSARITKTPSRVSRITRA
ncbi:hypothetical protein ACMFWY_08750 [Roseiconus sp. JC912]|uniref:hypothetical protein n=1 Tax=Roseiconus sp. JC912 TaxID=3396307 RepID=UPI003A4C616E